MTWSFDCPRNGKRFAQQPEVVCAIFADRHSGKPESRERACTPEVRCDGFAVDDQHETLRPSVGRAHTARHDDLPDGFVELLLRLTARCAFHFRNHMEAFML